MIESCLKLQNYPVDLIVIPCNSAHFWIEEVKQKVKTPIASMVDLAAQKSVQSSENKNVSFLGGMVTYQKDLYKTPIERQGGNYFKIDLEDQKAVESWVLLGKVLYFDLGLLIDSR